MNADIITKDVCSFLRRRFGQGKQVSRGSVFTFGTNLTCSINYSKLLNGHKYFYAIPQDMLKPEMDFPKTQFGEFALLICGSTDKVLVLPRALVIEMMRGVPSRRVDVFLEDGAYVLQTTKHPKLHVTEYLNAFPVQDKPHHESSEREDETTPDRMHVKMQWSLITLGRAEGCSVWVPTNDRNLSYQKRPFSDCTLSRLPNFGFEENTRRIIHYIDVLWLDRNIIRRAFEVESTTSIYSGLLRLNDLVLAQPNNKIELSIAASKARRSKVYDQLIRPSFQSLLPICGFISFEDIEDQVRRLEAFPIETGARVTGLVRAERFPLPDHPVYPSGL